MYPINLIVEENRLRVYTQICDQIRVYVYMRLDILKKLKRRKIAKIKQKEKKTEERL